MQITDQPAERPDSGPIPTNQRERHLLLSLAVPEPSEAKDTVALVKQVFSLVDVIDQKPAFKVEVGSLSHHAVVFAYVCWYQQTYKKLKKTRVDLDAELVKEAEKEKRDEVGIGSIGYRKVSYVE